MQNLGKEEAIRRRVVPENDIKLSGTQKLVIDAAWSHFSETLSPKRRNIAWHYIGLTRHGKNWGVEFSPIDHRDGTKLDMVETEKAGSGFILIDPETMKPAMIK